MNHQQLVTDRPPQARPGVVCIAFAPRVSGSLRGFADFLLPRHRLKIFACGIHESHGKRWASLPGKAQIDRERRVLTDAKGKVKYAQVLAWADDETRTAFSEAAISALLAFAPDAFETEEGEP